MEIGIEQSPHSLSEPLFSDSSSEGVSAGGHIICQNLQQSGWTKRWWEKVEVDGAWAEEWGVAEETERGGFRVLVDQW